MTEALTAIGALMALFGALIAIFAILAIPVQLIRRRSAVGPLWVTAAFMLVAVLGGGLVVFANRDEIGRAGAGAPVKRSPHDLIMSARDFPLAGYTLDEDRDRSGGWRRSFKAPTTEPQYSTVIVDLFSSGSASWVRSQTCTWNSAEAPATSTPVSAPPTGDAAFACRHRWADGSRWYELTTTTRGAGLYLSVYVPVPPVLASNAAPPAVSAPFPDDREAMTFLARLAERQIALIDRADPPDSLTLRPPQDTLAAQLNQALRFAPPATLPPVVIGQTYRYSFCKPERASIAEPCDRPRVSEPTEGTPPYRFVYARGGGFPPFGLVLHPNGELEGTINPRTAAGNTRFSICAVDAKDASVCREVSLDLRKPAG